MLFKKPGLAAIALIVFVVFTGIADVYGFEEVVGVDPSVV
jgi:hypothetical protein